MVEVVLVQSSFVDTQYKKSMSYYKLLFYINLMLIY